MATLTIEKIAAYFVEEKEKETANFINKNANKIYCASYRSGTYGKIFVNFIKNNYLTPLKFNGMLTPLAIEITDQMSKKGYKFNNTGKEIIFSKETEKKQQTLFD